MLERQVGSVRFRLSLLFPALLTALLLSQPTSPTVSCVIACVMHECGHLLMMTVLRCPPHTCTLSAYGMRIEMGARRLVGYRRNILISLAGPAVNLFSAPILWMLNCRQAAVVHGLLAVFNLLPASALDGGQAVYCLLCMHGKEAVAERWVRVLSAAVLVPVAAIAFWLYFSGRGNATLLIVSVYVVSLIFWHTENQ